MVFNFAGHRTMGLWSMVGGMVSVRACVGISASTSVIPVIDKHSKICWNHHILKSFLHSFEKIYFLLISLELLSELLFLFFDREKRAFALPFFVLKFQPRILTKTCFLKLCKLGNLEQFEL